MRVRRIGGVFEDERYRAILGSSNGLFLADDIQHGSPVAVFEGEIDAPSASQSVDAEAACVALGGLTQCRVPSWTVLLCFDNEADPPKAEAVEAAITYWQGRLKKARRLHYSEGYHDCNDMLQRGADVRSWLFSGLSSFASAVRPGEELEHLRREIPPCAVCGAMMDGYYGGKWLCARHWDEARKVQP